MTSYPETEKVEFDLENMYACMTGEFEVMGEEFKGSSGELGKVMEEEGFAVADLGTTGIQEYLYDPYSMDMEVELEAKASALHDTRSNLEAEIDLLLCDIEGELLSIEHSKSIPYCDGEYIDRLLREIDGELGLAGVPLSDLHLALGDWPVLTVGGQPCPRIHVLTTATNVKNPSGTRNCPGDMEAGGGGGREERRSQSEVMRAEFVAQAEQTNRQVAERERLGPPPRSADHSPSPVRSGHQSYHHSLGELSHLEEGHQLVGRGEVATRQYY